MKRSKVIRQWKDKICRQESNEWGEMCSQGSSQWAGQIRSQGSSQCAGQVIVIVIIVVIIIIILLLLLSLLLLLLLSSLLLLLFSLSISPQNIIYIQILYHHFHIIISSSVSHTKDSTQHTRGRVITEVQHETYQLLTEWDEYSTI